MPGAFSLEAYINYYAAHYDIPFHNDYEKSLSTVNKWKIYPSLKINKTLEKPALDIIQKVFKLRNEIVHPKPERIKHGSVQPGNKSIKNIQGIIEVMDKGQFFIDVTSVFSSIFKIDPEEKKIYNDGPWLCHLKKAKQ